MLIVLGAVLVITMVLNLFLLFVIRQMSVITNRQVQQHFSRELEFCTEELEEKLKELKTAQDSLQGIRQQIQEQKAVQQSMLVYGQDDHKPGQAAVVKRNARYRSAESLDTYRYIRDHMKPDYQELVKKAVERKKETGEEQDLCGSILKKLDFETAYRLVTSPAKEQERILNRLLTKEEQEFLEQTAPGGEFTDIIARLDKIRQYRMLHSSEVVVQCGEKDQDQKQYGSVKVEYDPDIHEGIRLRMGSEMLDYSL